MTFLLPAKRSLKLLGVVPVLLALALSLRAATGEAGPSLAQFSRINVPGFGDRQNSYSWSMGWFQGNLYVGTARNGFCVQRAIADYYLPGFGLYVAQPDPDISCAPNPYDLDLRAEIWRFTPGGGWTRVYQSPSDLVNPRDPTRTVVRDIGFRNMSTLTNPNGSQALYVAGVTAAEYLPGLPPPRILRSTDGVTFQPVTLDFPPLLNTVYGLLPPVSFRGLTLFNGRIFLTCSPNVQGDGVILEAKMVDPAGTHWSLTQVSPSSLDVFEISAFNGFLYAGAAGASGYSVWKTSANGASPYVFTPVVTDGAGQGSAQASVVSMFPFGGRLYVGTSVTFQASLQQMGAEVIRINPDDSWQVVAGNARWTAQGFKTPISGLPPGFGNPFNDHIWRMQEHQGTLYLGTLDTTWYYRTIPLFDAILKSQYGFDLFATTDGVFWTPVTQNAFGLSSDVGARIFTSTPSGLFLGTINDALGTSVLQGVGGGAQPAAAVPRVTQASLAAPGRLEAETQNGATVLSWDVPPGAAQVRVFRQDYQSNQVLHISRLPSLPSLPNDPRLQRIESLVGNVPLAPDAWVPTSAVPLGTTSQWYFQDSAVLASARYAYYVQADDGRGGLSAPSNLVIVPSLTSPVTFDQVTSTIQGLASRGRITAGGAAPLLQDVSNAQGSVSTGDYAGALTALQDLRNRVVQNQSGFINPLDANDLEILVSQLMRRVSLAQAGVLSLGGPTATPTLTPSVTSSPTPILSVTDTPTPTFAATSTPTATPSSAAPTFTPTPASQPTATPTPSSAGASPPGPPSSLSASAGQPGQVTLRWSASTTPGVTYWVYRGTSSGGETPYRSGVTGTGFTDTSVARAVVYWYKVTAVSSAGAESAPSNEAFGLAF